MRSIQAGGAARTELAGGEAAAEPAASDSSSGGGRGAASRSLPASNLVYKAKDYWDSRFSEEESYDVSYVCTYITKRDKYFSRTKPDAIACTLYIDYYIPYTYIHICSTFK